MKKNVKKDMKKTCLYFLKQKCPTWTLFQIESDLITVIILLLHYIYITQKLYNQALSNIYIVLWALHWIWFVFNGFELFESFRTMSGFFREFFSDFIYRKNKSSVSSVSLTLTDDMKKWKNYLIVKEKIKTQKLSIRKM